MLQLPSLGINLGQHFLRVISDRFLDVVLQDKKAISKISCKICSICIPASYVVPVSLFSQ